MKRTFIFLLLLGACDRTVPISGQKLHEAERFVQADQRRTTVEMAGLWYGQGLEGFLGCGEFKSPPSLANIQPRLRFYYDFERHRGQVEYHQLWLAMDGDYSLIQTNRMLFDDLWSKNCEPFKPLSISVLETFS